MSDQIQISVPANSEFLELAADFLLRAKGILDNRPGIPFSDYFEDELRAAMAPAADLETVIEDTDALDAFVELEALPEEVAPPSEPVYELTAKAEGFTLEDFYKQGWNNQQLIDNGYLVAVPLAPAPAPAAAAPAPTAPTAPAPILAPVPTTTQAATTSDVELDVEGIPWDARIHSSSKEKIANGAFKVKRNTPPELVTSVKAELKQLLANGSPVAAARAPAPSAGPKTQTGAAPAPAGSLTPCAALMRKASAAIRAGTLTQAHAKSN